MRCKPHARFGRRPGETEQSKRCHRAPGRPHLAGDALDRCRRRVQQAPPRPPRPHRRPALRAPGAPCTPAPDLLTDKQIERLDALFAADDHVEVEVTWGVYQRMIAAYREPDRRRGRQLMATLIDSLSHGVPAALTEVVTLGRTLEQARRRRARLLRPARHLQRTNRGDQRPTRTPPRLRPRLPQPHQLHRPITTRNRRLQTPTTPSIVKSPFVIVVERPVDLA